MGSELRMLVNDHLFRYRAVGVCLWGKIFLLTLLPKVQMPMLGTSRILNTIDVSFRA